MKRLSALLLLIPLLLCACGGEKTATVSGGGEEARALEAALTALLSADADTYLSAFPPEMGEDYEEQYVYSYYFGAGSMEEYLEASLAAYGESYGDGIRITGEIVSIEVTDVEAFGDANLDYYTYNRYVTEENTEEAKSAVFKYTVGGDRGSEEKEARIYFVKQNGSWYLHPCFAFYSF